MQLAAFRIDFGADFGLAAVSRARRFSDRIFHGAEHDLAIDRFFTRDRVGDLQKFEPVGANGRHWSLALVWSLFALAQRFGNQRVGENEPGFRHIVDTQQNVVGFFTTNAGAFARGAVELATEPFAAFDWRLHFNLRGVAGIAVEVGPAHQGAIDAGRRDFQAIGTLDRIGDIENRRQRARDGFTVLNRHRSVGPLGHDLHGATGKAGYSDADQAITKPGEHRLG